MIVLRRWAMVKTVQALNADRIVVCTSSSVLWSIAAVASSNRIILVFRMRARARHNSCLCPTLKIIYQSKTRYLHYKYSNSFYLRLFPPSLHSNINFPGNSWINSFKLTLSSADHSSWSEWASNGSRFIRIEPEKITGSWGIIVIRCLTSCSPISLILTSSITISP